jgi:predicted transcriptional regulator
VGSRSAPSEARAFDSDRTFEEASHGGQWLLAIGHVRTHGTAANAGPWLTLHEHRKCNDDSGRFANARLRRRQARCSTFVLQCPALHALQLELAMSTTTIRLPDDLKARVAAAAKRTGTTAHNFILEAIAEKTEEEERRGDFDDVAEKRYAAIVASGKTIPWSEMRTYLAGRAAGKKPRRPTARKLAR